METNFSKIKATGKLLSSKQISCEELTKQYLASIEKENQVLNAYVKVTEEQALLRIHAQPEDSFYLSQCDVILDGCSASAELYEQIADIVRKAG